MVNRKAMEGVRIPSDPLSWTPAEVRDWIARHGGNISALARRLRVGRSRLQNWASDSQASARPLPPYVQAHMETLDAGEESASNGAKR